jgi:hypothetical protein
MKNLYNTIEQNLKVGLNVVVKDLENNYYCIISNSKDAYGFYRDSGWRDSIEKAKQYIGSYSRNSKEYWDEKDLEIVEVYRPEYEPFKVGDKVRILDSIKKTSSWEIIFNLFPNMIGEIEKVYNQIDGINYRVSGYIIGHEYLAPLNEEEEVIKVGDKIYSKKEVEEALKNIKPL